MKVFVSRGFGGRLTRGKQTRLTNNLHSQCGLYCLPLLLPGLPIGVRIPVCLTYAGRIFTRMVAAYDRGDMVAAFKEQENIQTIQTLLKKYGGGAKKALSGLVGMPLGPSRLPIKDPSEEELKAMEEEVEQLGIKDFL